MSLPPPNVLHRIGCGHQLATEFTRRTENCPSLLAGGEPATTRTPPSRNHRSASRLDSAKRPAICSAKGSESKNEPCSKIGAFAVCLSADFLASVEKGLPHGFGTSLVVHQAGALVQGRPVDGNKPVLLYRSKYRLCLLRGGLLNEALSVHNGIKEQKKLDYQ